MGQFNLNQNDHFAGLTLDALKNFISSCPKEELKKIFVGAKARSKVIELNESKQFRLTEEILKRPFDILIAK